MADPTTTSTTTTTTTTIDPQTGFNPTTKTFHSLRPPATLPPPSQPLSITSYALSLLHSNPTFSPSTTPFLIDPSTDQRLSYHSFIHQVHSLSSNLASILYPPPHNNNITTTTTSNNNNTTTTTTNNNNKHNITTTTPTTNNNNNITTTTTSTTNNNTTSSNNKYNNKSNLVGLILAPTSVHIPVIYFSLLSLGVIVSPVNPVATTSELVDLIKVSKPVIVFATSSVAKKLPPSYSFSFGVIIIDSPRFESMLHSSLDTRYEVMLQEVKQSDTAAILYSSGTTGRIKGVELTHRNFIAITSVSHNSRFERGEPDPTGPVSLFPLPLFHVFGFFMLIRAMSLGETLVLMEKFDFGNMLKAVEKYKVTYMPVSPPLVVAMAKSDLVPKYDLSSLVLIGCGGAPLGKEVAKSFAVRFPHVEIVQGYGMTETGGGVTGMTTPDECEHYGSAGRLSCNVEAKIVDPETGEALSPMQQGELWLRGPMIMKGYVRDKEATAATMESDGWLKTGDLCYFDSDGFLFIVDRLKELIKYKAYQVPPAELERYLQSIPEVVDAAVIPYPDEEAGQIPMAYVVRQSGSKISEAQIMEIITKKVSPYKKIRKVAFINAIPKTPAGKILRRELVKHALSGASSKL